MNKTIATAILGLTVMFAASATAAEFKDGAKVTISNKKKIHNGSYLVLKKQGEDKNGDGIYHITSPSGPNLIAFKNKSGVGTPVGYEKDYQTKWILHKNSTGWSIISAANGANTVSVKKDGKLELQRNQGYKHQVFKIEEAK